MINRARKKYHHYASSPPCNSQNSFLQSPYFNPSNFVNQTSPYSRKSRRIEDVNTEMSPSSCSQRLTNGDTAGSLPELKLRLEGLKPVLIQDRVADDPWKLLVAVTLLNKTAGKLAIPAFWNIMANWPTPVDLSQVDEEELIPIIRHLGTQNIRAKRLIAMSRSYIQEPPSVYDFRPSSTTSPSRHSRFFASSSIARRYPATPISHLPGTGSYALDSYRIFCTVHDYPGSEEWKTVLPADKELIRYIKWKWACSEGMEWSPTKGVICKVTAKYLSALISTLENDRVSQCNHDCRIYKKK